MRDKTKKILLPENPFEKIHGHTKIELTDIRNGQKKVIEHDNDFQAGVLANYMRSMGAYDNNPYANSTWAGQPIWRNLCGGIFCFEDEIDNSNNEVEYMPAGNKMIANGAYGVTNSGTPTELGSYNSNESSTSGNDSITFVYDFNSSQGNGTISCVCLTTEIGGYIGYGNPSGAAASTKKNLNANQSSSSLSNDPVQGLHLGIIYKNNRVRFRVDAGAKKVTVTKTPTEISKGSIFDNIAEDNTEVSFSGTVTGSFMCAIYLGGGKAALLMYSSAYQNLAPNATYSFILYDLETDTATVESITNTTGETLYISYNTPYAMPPHGASGNYLILQSTAGKVWAINYNTSVSVQIGTGYTSQLMSGKGDYGAITDELIIFSNNSNSYIFDPENQTAYPINCNQRQMRYNDDLDAITNDVAIYKNPLILATVNNLDTPVTKTAAQTMKITYELTKASE